MESDCERKAKAGSDSPRRTKHIEALETFHEDDLDDHGKSACSACLTDC